MSNHYGQSLSVTVKDGLLQISIGVHVLCNAVAYAEWANVWNDELYDYVRQFAITEPDLLANDVRHEMLHEREDGSTPLSDFLDAMTENAVNEGSMGVLFDRRISAGKTDPDEPWVHGLS